MDPQPSATRNSLWSVRDRAEARNAAACASPPLIDAEVASPTRSDDVKRNSAASLAQELATSSPWSEVFMPRAYSTSTMGPSNTHDLAYGQEQGNMYPLDPPPAYSNAPEVHELPTESVHNLSRARHSAPDVSFMPAASTTPVTPLQVDNLRSQQPNSELQNAMQEPEQTAQTPLLEDVARQAVEPICNWWERRRTIKKRRRQLKRRFGCSVFLVILGTLLILCAMGSFGKVFHTHR